MATSIETGEGPEPESESESEPEPRPELVQTTDHFYHVRIRPKEAFEELRTPPEDAELARAVVGDGCDVREGRLDAETWLVESVLVPRYAAEDGTEAEALAGDLVGQIES